MNTRERVLSVLNKKIPDMVPWFGDLDYWIYYLNTSGKMQDKYKGDNGVVLYYMPKSPLIEMVALLAGIEATTFALLDEPDEEAIKESAL